MKTNYIGLLISVVALHVGLAANAQPLKAFYIGHSLSDQIAEMVQSLTDDTEDVYFDWRYQSIPGSPLIYHWERMAADDYTAHPPHIYPFYDPTNGLPAGDFDVLVMVDSVPRQSEGEWGIAMTYTYSGLFLDYAVLHNQSPEGLTNQLQNTWGGDFDPAPTPEQAAIFQTLAWETVTEYWARAGYLTWRTNHFDWE